MCFSQTAVTLFNGGQFTSILQNGQPNAFGCVFFFASGTSTPLDTYTDYTGVTKNRNPVLLSAAGTANTWLISGSLYSVTVTTTDGQSCTKPLGSGGSTIYTANGINQGLLNTANIWQAPQTFLATTYFSLTDSQMVFGTTGSQTMLDIPPTSGNYTLHGPPITANDTLVSQNGIQNLTNKSFGGTPVCNGPGAYYSAVNDTGIIGGLVSLINGSFGTAFITPAGATGGIVGIGCSLGSSTITIQQSGTINCIFDGAATSPDYVQASSTVAGDCHDAGATYPISGQVIGRVLQNITGAGSTLIDLFGPEIQGNSTLIGGGTVISKMSSGSGTLSSGTTTITISALSVIYSCYASDSTTPTYGARVTVASGNVITVVGNSADNVTATCFGH